MSSLSTTYLLSLAYCWAVLKPSWTFALLPWPQDDQSDHKIPSKSSGCDAERERENDRCYIIAIVGHLNQFTDLISFFSSPFLRVSFCWIFPPIFLQFSSSKRSLLPTVPPLQIKPPQWHHKNCIVATLSPYLLLSTVEGTFSHFPFNMIMKTDFWLTDHLMLVTYTREITTSYPIRGSTLHLLLPSGHFLDVLKINHHFKLWKKKSHLNSTWKCAGWWEQILAIPF